MKTEVYSWRVSADLKSALEREARRRKASLSALLDLAARDWLSKGYAETQGDEEQLRLQKAAAQCFGAFAGRDAHRSENVGQELRQRLRKKYDR
jgi:type II secretory pathway component PulL